MDNSAVALNGLDVATPPAPKDDEKLGVDGAEGDEGLEGEEGADGPDGDEGLEPIYYYYLISGK